MVDVFTDFIINHTTTQDILLTVMIIGGVLALVLKAGIRQLETIILSICLVFIYLYYLDLISITIFAFVLVILSTTLFVVFKKKKSVEI